MLRAVIAAIALVGSGSDTSTGNDGGVWLGPMKLCRNVVTASMMTTEYSGEPALEITLTSELAPTLAEVTRRIVGQPLAVRLNGRVIAEPIVDEPIERGEVQISGPDERTLKEL